ncbi:MAG: hypothetical protein V7K98_11805 [Nostoc sp.]|uniref:hypothetical protein n=1 Tax=Nostoc sp. TaxID=1180 RepID=UPI002FF84588
MSDCRAENTERGEIKRIFASVLEYFFICKSLVLLPMPNSQFPIPQFIDFADD